MNQDVLNSKLKLGIIIPVYHNAETLELLYETIVNLKLEEVIAYNIMFVNDGSKDESWNILRRLEEQSSRIRLIAFTKNFGQIAAVKAGLQKSLDCDYLLVVSADLQDPIELIPKLVEEINEKIDLVVAYRNSRNDRLVSRIGSKIFYTIINFFNEEVPSGGFDFFLMKNKVAREFLKLSGRHRFFQGDLLSLGFTTKFIPYQRSERQKGISKLNLGKRVKYAIDGFLHTSYSPIRWMSVIGFLSFLAGILYSFIIVYNYWINTIPFKGWAPLMILILIIGGLNLFFLGIIGEYIWRIYDNIIKKPEYIIQEEIN